MAGLDLGEIEQIVDDTAQQLGGVRNLDLLQIIRPCLGIEIGAERQRGEAGDGVDRGADLVAHIRQEGAFRLAGVVGAQVGALQLRVLLVAGLRVRWSTRASRSV